ncbi:unnamed protein product [Arctia plantaginis]|uniref:Uncharacterized protein n=1 Tax=Arctia plantaginis TaxID=874455 RepID=A0A8S1APJ5_ARCPL|nr:unnamed protein product [Arctia plantaginis]
MNYNSVGFIEYGYGPYYINAQKLKGLQLAPKLFIITKLNNLYNFKLVSRETFMITLLRRGNLKTAVKESSNYRRNLKSHEHRSKDSLVLITISRTN